MPLIDFTKYCDKITDRTLEKMNVYNDPVFKGTKAIRFFNWFGKKFTPFVLNIGSFLVLLWVFNRIVNNYGVERLFAVFVAIYVMSLRLQSQNERQKEKEKNEGKPKI